MKPVVTVRPSAFVLVAIVLTLAVAAACGGGTGGQDRPTPGSGNAPVQGAARATVAPGDPAADQAPPDRATPVVSRDPETSKSVLQPAGSPAPAAQDGEELEATIPVAPVAQVPALAPTPEAAAPGDVGGEIGDRAPEFQGIANWINSKPLTMEELRGNVVLIDFWTYTCVNCIRTLPYLKEWHAKYAGHGLVIVGVHTPEFEFEKVTENVVRSAAGFALKYPIAQDNGFGTWRAFNNRFWPAKYLVDRDGTVQYTHFGEGAYDVTEERIHDLLVEAGADLSGVEISARTAPQLDPSARTADAAGRITREIYGGFRRNASSQGVYVAHRDYYDESESVVFYTDPGDHENQFIYLQGPWFSGLEKLGHARETQGYEDHIALKFFATSVNAVIDPEGGEPFRVQVSLDGRSLRPEEAGADVQTEGGQSFFNVDEGRMYEVVALPEFAGHELKLSANSPDFALFAFTFGAYTEGP